MADFSFPKSQKLKSRKLIDSLFSEGESVKAFPVIGVWRKIEAEETRCQVGFSVSKRNFRRAVDRNLIKRQMREAFRLNQGFLSKAEREGSQLVFMIIYVGKDLPEYAALEKKIITLLKRLAEIE